MPRQEHVVLESAVEQKLVAALHEVDLNILVLKFTVPGQAGFHDRLVLLPGAVAIYVELKRPRGKPRKLQVYRHGQIMKLGFASCVVDTPESIEALVQLAIRLLTARKQK